MRRRTPRSTRPDTLVPYTTLFRSCDAEAACASTDLPPTTSRITGSMAKLSASFTSSYPASRPNTDCRNNPSSRWSVFFPVRLSRSASDARLDRPSTSSSSRITSRPPSELICAPRNSRRTRRSKSRSEEHTSELQSLMRISYAVFCLKKKKKKNKKKYSTQIKNIKRTCTINDQKYQTVQHTRNITAKYKLLT